MVNEDGAILQGGLTIPHRLSALFLDAVKVTQLPAPLVQGPTVFEVALEQQQKRFVPMCIGVMWRQCQGLVIAKEGFIKAQKIGVQIAQIGQCETIIGLQI